MALHLVAERDPQPWNAIETLVDAEGSASHAHVGRLCSAERRGPGERRAGERADASDRRARASADQSMARRVDLADALHALCAVHGAHRGLADEAREHPAAGAALAWLDAVGAALATERGLLARAVSAAGPLPSTPGQAATDAAFVAQRHAFHMLARSDRVGVATGAVAALALDWTVIRAVMTRAADAYGLAVPPLALPPREDAVAMLDRVAGDAATRRAALFGARALLDQHRALWTLLEARAAARQG